MSRLIEKAEQDDEACVNGMLCMKRYQYELPSIAQDMDQWMISFTEKDENDIAIVCSLSDSYEKIMFLLYKNNSCWDLFCRFKHLKKLSKSEMLVFIKEYTNPKTSNLTNVPFDMNNKERYVKIYTIKK